MFFLLVLVSLGDPGLLLFWEGVFFGWLGLGLAGFFGEIGEVVMSFFLCEKA